MSTKITHTQERSEQLSSFASLLQAAGIVSRTTLLIVLIGIAFGLIVWVKSRTAAEFFSDPLLLGYTLFVTLFQLSRVISAGLFPLSRESVLAGVPKELRSVPYEPTISFVVPCKDEEAAIRNTVTQCFRAEYPSDKVEVIVINDGSTDNTGTILRELEQEYDNLQVVHWEKNRGKRHGMAEGFRRATGEIIIQLDSDSYIIPETVRDFIAPFKNPNVGAVCAHADPENADENMLTKMQSAYYFMSFRILKAAESSYGVVFCCSGCSSAYRRSIVMPIVDVWLNETFLKLPVTWGDDRGLTNWVIKEGYRTIYTDQARAYTIVPNTLKQFIKQQVRWKKGWLVNSIFASKFILKREPFVAVLYFFPLTLVTLLTPFMAARAFLYTPFFKDPWSLSFYIGGVILVVVILILFYKIVAPKNRYWPYLFVWAGINMFILSFLLFYAFATIQNRKWGTR